MPIVPQRSLRPHRFPPGRRMVAWALALLGLAASILPARADPTAPDPAHIFAPFTWSVPPGRTRSAGGVPGPDYWQNRADYRISATLDGPTHQVRGEEVITYTNNSPDTLDELWVQLDQNIYKAGSRASFSSRFFGRDTTDGDVIESIWIENGKRTVPVDTLVSDTRMRVTLPEPLAGHGTALKLHIRWHHTVPGAWGGRTAITDSRNGPIWELGQWFPRMAVYDDVRGWDTAPYLGQEFYLEYGDIDYTITVPASWIVAGSGALLNPAEVLTRTQQDRLRQAGDSEKTIAIRAPSEITDPNSRPAKTGTLSWHFRMENTRDVAVAASPAFAWDAARIDLPPLPYTRGGKPMPRLAMSVYPAEAAENGRWSRSTEYVKSAIENFSRRWYPYPYPTAINVGGHGAGMEYPGMAFDGIKDEGRELFWITTHELGHNWFPMVVGTNERRNGFMDEGFNTFIDVYQSDDFNRGEWGPKRDAEYAPGQGTPAEQIANLLRDPNAPTLLEPTDLVTERYRHPVTYFKSAFGLTLLREQILGPDRFDPAFRRYIAAWAFKHPTPDDFFRLMNSEAGEDLSWFWRGWYAENARFDIGIARIVPVEGDPRRGTQIELHNNGSLVLPEHVAVHLDDGTTRSITLPVEAWMKGNVATITLPGGVPVRSVTLDPDRVLPDTNRDNDTLDVRHSPPPADDTPDGGN
ncbi:M1 family metallopeptidase [Rhizosaccharibacter radicis]|uniref:M1 family metallopeptidase n=1 Tax=Rhizosaccharibacter radicis TaxID=2782605 RepID=A0ABT1VTW5_9PROT|nr:M1 family metallopeptidase [Acetobacteraceae bacterium KSS12]